MHKIDSPNHTSPQVTVSLFGELQEKYIRMGITPIKIPVTINPGETVKSLMKRIGVDQEKVECVFINGRASSFEANLKDGDRIGFVPYGTPGPHRYLLGIYNRGKSK